MYNQKDIILSVRLMTYNHELYIEEALDSIFSQQTNFKFEVVIGDDFSTDNTLAIIKNFINKNNKENIIWKLLERNKGDSYDITRQKVGRLYNFFNIIENCIGTYIALLDGDDYWADSYKLQKQVDSLETNDEYSGAYTDTEVLINNKTKLWRENLPSTMELKDVINTISPFHTSSFIFRNDAIKNVDFSIFKNIQSGDMLLFTLVASKGLFKKIDCKPTVYRKHEGGITNNKQNNSWLLDFNRISLWLQLKDVINKEHQKFDVIIIHHFINILKTNKISIEEVLKKIKFIELIRYYKTKIFKIT
jgi:glycosyltransferase involved in cell wall biosynthesis